MSSPNRSRPRDGLSSDDFDSESSILVRVFFVLELTQGSECIDNRYISHSRSVSVQLRDEVALLQGLRSFTYMVIAMVTDYRYHDILICYTTKMIRNDVHPDEQSVVGQVGASRVLPQQATLRCLNHQLFCLFVCFFLSLSMFGMIKYFHSMPH